MDSGLLPDGLINSQLGQIQELISPAQNYYNSLFVQVQHRLSQGFSLQFGYTYAKSIQLDGMDFNNQFDLSNTHAPSLLDERHRLTLAAVYRPRLEQLTTSDAGRKFLSGWTLSTVMEFSSGRPYAGLLGTACTTSTAMPANTPMTISTTPPSTRTPQLPPAASMAQVPRPASA